MLVKTSLLLQSLLVGLSPYDPNSSEDLRLDNEVDWRGTQLTPIPDPKDYAKMARFIVHNANWTSVAYISAQPSTRGLALADMFSVSDGSVDMGCGVPYLYVSRLQAAVTDLLDSSSACSLTMGLQQTAVCKERGWDDEDPRCAHIVLTGDFQVVDVDSAEFVRAQKALFERHPTFRGLPASHHFFVAKYNIKTITLQDFFGGPVDVPLTDYFNVKDMSFGLVPAKRKMPRKVQEQEQSIWDNYLPARDSGISYNDW